MSIDGLTPPAATFLAQARVAHLAPTDGEGQPHVVPITFVLLDERLYSALDAKPKRVAASGCAACGTSSRTRGWRWWWIATARTGRAWATCCSWAPRGWSRRAPR